jgi:hypothetical protein
MQRMLARADLNMRIAENDSLMAMHEHLSMERPTAPEFRMPPGLGAAYCAMLKLFAVQNAEAAAPQEQAASVDQPRVDPIALQRARNAFQEARLRREDARLDRNRYDVEIQKKFSLAASCLIFVLIGAPIALRFPRGGVGLVIGVSFAIFGVYYVGLIGGETLANKGYLPPWVAMWGANIVLAAIGLVLSVRMGRESATTRGGDWGDKLIMLRDAFTERVLMRKRQA